MGKIKCSVTECSHYCGENETCELDSIKVCPCDDCGCDCKEMTMCDSYKENNIIDN
ncbi:MAG: DUF1540 domain-containing protein [Bacilli bacterium]